MNANPGKHEERDLVLRFNALPREKQEYILSNLAGQLHKAEQNTQLYALIEKQWMELKFDLTNSHQSFARDVETAIAAAHASVPTHWVQLVRNCMIFATLGSLATNVPPYLLGLVAQSGEVNKALGHTALIENAENQTLAYQLIAEALLAEDQPHKAKVTLRLGVAAAGRIGEPRRKVQALIKIANLLAQAGDNEAALEIVNRAEQKTQHQDFEEAEDRTMRAIAEAFANAGDVERALTRARSLVDPVDLMLAATRTAEIHCAKGDLPGALKAIGIITSIPRKSVALARLATELMRIGENAQSLWLMQLIPDLEFRAEAFAWTAKLLAKKNQKEQAVLLAKQGLSMARAIDSDFHATVINDLAQALAISGEVDQALDAVRMIRGTKAAANSLNDLVTQLSGQAENTAAARIALQALSMAETVEDGWFKAVKAGVFAAAVVGGEIERSLETAKSIPDKTVQTLAFSSIARALAEKGEMAHVEQILDGVLEHVTSFRQAHSVMDYSEKQIFEDTLHNAALTFANKGQLSDGLRILETNLVRHELLEFWIRFGGSLLRTGLRQAAAALANHALETFSAMDQQERDFAKVYDQKIVLALARVGRLDWAHGMIEAMDEGAKVDALKDTSLALVHIGKPDYARQMADLVTNGPERAQCLKALAQCLAEAGHVQPARQAVDDALLLIEGVGDFDSHINILADASKVLLRIGDQTQALLLLDRMLALLREQDGAREDKPARMKVLMTLTRAGDEGFERASQLVENMKHPEEKTFAIIQLAAAQLEVQKIETAQDLAQRAFDLAVQISKEEDKATALAQLSEVFAQCERSRS